MSSTLWSPETAHAWADKQPWLLGSNFIPSSAINQLEMFQPDDYDRHRPILERELEWSAEVGMNTHRIFLHDIAWKTDQKGFLSRLDDFLDLCESRTIRPLLVFFDACHRPYPVPGQQPAPRPGIHNSGWAQSPAADVLCDRGCWKELERYVLDVLGRYGQDERVLAWDLYNEPCNCSFDTGDPPSKAACSAELTGLVFEWARSASPQQPVTVGIWQYETDPLLEHDEQALASADLALLNAQRIALKNSDILSFHHYGTAETLSAKVDQLLELGRPLWCTEYMARTRGSLFQTCLPLLHKKKVAAYNWGFVSGKSNTIFPWGSPEGADEPEPWFHDVLHANGMPYDQEETQLIRSLSGAIA
ncbi:MAG: 1,4-beta-xylanase [Candidatus Methylacidiphilales bacterium]